MNKFIYKNNRLFSTDIKSLYPKCINCINFNNSNNTCKKFQITSTPNYINDFLIYESAINVRNNKDKCGEPGKLFENNYIELIKENELNYNICIFGGIITGATSLLTDNFAIFLIPFFATFAHSVFFLLNIIILKI